MSLKINEQKKKEKGYKFGLGARTPARKYTSDIGVQRFQPGTSC